MAKKRPSIQKRDREQKKRERRIQKAEKAELNRAAKAQKSEAPIEDVLQADSAPC